MDCVLCKIARGELAARIIYDDDFCIGILDNAPCAAGHCLVVPKQHVEKFYELDDGDLAKLFTAVKRIALKIRSVYSPDHVCIFARGGRLPHLHVAVFPSNEGDGVSGFPQSNYPRLEIDLERSADLLRNA